MRHNMKTIEIQKVANGQRPRLHLQQSFWTDTDQKWWKNEANLSLIKLAAPDLQTFIFIVAMLLTATFTIACKWKR